MSRVDSIVSSRKSSISVPWPSQVQKNENDDNQQERKRLFPFDRWMIMQPDSIPANNNNDEMMRIENPSENKETQQTSTMITANQDTWYDDRGSTEHDNDDNMYHLLRDDHQLQQKRQRRRRFQHQRLATTTTSKRVISMAGVGMLYAFYLVFVLLLVGATGILGWVYMVNDELQDMVASCGDCYCIPESGSSCPGPEHMPPTTFAPDLLRTLDSQIPQNPYRLNCNPYTDADCQVQPLQELTDWGDDQAVCGIHYITNEKNIVEDKDKEEKSCGQDWTYTLQTYPSWEAATLAGAFVTHTGSCGVCSTTQDLAAYMRTFDLATAVTTCAKQSVVHNLFDDGDSNSIMDCLMYEIGLTEDCARIWYFNIQQTFSLCGPICAWSRLIQEPNNGPEPVCALNTCLQCDEYGSGPIFQRVAGRTRRRSGLLSAIARPCNSIAPIQHTACPSNIYKNKNNKEQSNAAAAAARTTSERAAVHKKRTRVPNSADTAVRKIYAQMKERVLNSSVFR